MDKVAIINFPNATRHAARHVIFEIAVKCLMLGILNLKICKVASAMLGGQWSLLHVYVVILLFLFVSVYIAAVQVTAILVVITAITGVI